MVASAVGIISYSPTPAGMSADVPRGRSHRVEARTMNLDTTGCHRQQMRRVLFGREPKRYRQHQYIKSGNTARGRA